MNGACAEQPLRTGEPMNSSDGCIPKAPRRNAEETISAVLAAPDPFTMLCLPLPTLDDLGRPASVRDTGSNNMMRASPLFYRSLREGYKSVDSCVPSANAGHHGVRCLA